MTTGNEANSIRLSSVQVPGNCEIDKLLAGFDYEKERDGDYSTLNEGSIFLNDRLIASGSEDTSDLQYTRMRKQTFYPSLALLLKILCCLPFFWYGNCTREKYLFVNALIITALSCLEGLLISFFVYRNVKADRLPLKGPEKLIQMVLCMITAIYGAIIFSRHLFADDDLAISIYAKNWTDTQEALRIGHCYLSPYFSMWAACLYFIILLYDVIDVTLPLLWAWTILRTAISF
ncbi:envelope protein UL20 [Gallid alphaherpesvirus 1]|uniref:Envelope protein UL20 n=1 Tax=Infectious laryngotracheitis virus TaxID=10386 RepID=A0A0K0K620_ILTV|nr:envelope protein UL20 [Gallid alphaherpesvirus 1]